MVQILYVPAGSARASVTAHPCTPTAFSLCRLSVSLLSADLPLSTVPEAVACSLTAQAKLGPTAGTVPSASLPAAAAAFPDRALALRAGQGQT